MAVTRDQATGRIQSQGQRRGQTYSAASQMTKFEKKMKAKGWSKGESQRTLRKRNQRIVNAIKAGIEARRRR